MKIAAVLLIAAVGTIGCAPSPLGKSIDSLGKSIDSLSVEVPPMRTDYQWLTGVLTNADVSSCTAKKWPLDDDHCKRIAASMMNLLAEKYQPVPPTEGEK